MHFPIEFLLLGLVGKGTKWIGGKGWLPPKESGMPFKSRGKVGYLGADGKPAIDENDKPLTAKQKVAIMKKEEQMKAAEMGLEVKPEKKAKAKPASKKLLPEEEELKNMKTRLKELQDKKKAMIADGTYGDREKFYLGTDIVVLRDKIKKQSNVAKEARANQPKVEAQKREAERQSETRQQMEAQLKDRAERFKNIPKSDKKLGAQIGTIDAVAAKAGYRITASSKGYKVDKDGKQTGVMSLSELDKYLMDQPSVQKVIKGFQERLGK